jgi:hypothetical protein
LSCLLLQSSDRGLLNVQTGAGVWAATTRFAETISTDIAIMVRNGTSETTTTEVDITEMIAIIGTMIETDIMGPIMITIIETGSMTGVRITGIAGIAGISEIAGILEITEITGITESIMIIVVIGMEEEVIVERKKMVVDVMDGGIPIMVTPTDMTTIRTLTLARYLLIRLIDQLMLMNNRFEIRAL